MIFPLVGNEKIKGLIEKSIVEHRIPHAILVNGEKGTGRHLFSSYVSTAAVCNGDIPPCGVCSGCIQAQHGSHPDISVIAPEEGKKLISVAQIKQLRTDAFIKPHSAENKVIIIDKADTMNEQAQNALLKILEEPPGNLIFILITENKNFLLDTVLSRCIIFNLSVPSLNEATDYITENSDYSYESISSVLKENGNNIGRALSVLSGIADDSTRKLSQSFLNAVLECDEWKMLDAVRDLEDDRIEADRFFRFLKLDITDYMKKKSNSVFSRPLFDFYNRLCRLEEQLMTNINLSLLFSALTSTAIKCFENKNR